MTTIGSPPPGLVPVHIGLAEPGSAAAAPRPRHDRFAETPLQERSALTGTGIEWAKHGVQPRWLGQESWDCAVALEPGIFSSGGDDERKRFLAGAAERGETALLVSTIGDVNDDTPKRALSRSGASVLLPLLDGSIGGPRLPVGARPALAADLDRADRDLGLRLLSRPHDAPWWALEVAATYTESYNGLVSNPVPDGRLQPILVDGSGRPVVAAWIPTGENARWYIVPDATDWNTVIDWLVRHALPEYAPGALRRARHATFTDPDLQTERESRARQGLADLEDEFARRKRGLEEELRRAEELAAPVRNGLLYGTGDELAAVVAGVLTEAGLTVVDLDQELGATESADLLVTRGNQRRLVEVKSAGRQAGENLVDSLRKHLDTWPTVKPEWPVDGGVLIVNHQHKLIPQERSATVYSRKAFTDSLAYPVISTRDLFEWWRTADWEAVRDAVLGPVQAEAAKPSRSSAAPASEAQPSRPRRRLWRRGERSI